MANEKLMNGLSMLTISVTIYLLSKKWKPVLILLGPLSQISVGMFACLAAKGLTDGNLELSSDVRIMMFDKSAAVNLTAWLLGYTDFLGSSLLNMLAFSVSRIAIVHAIQ